MNSNLWVSVYYIFFLLFHQSIDEGVEISTSRLYFRSTVIKSFLILLPL